MFIAYNKNIKINKKQTKTPKQTHTHKKQQKNQQQQPTTTTTTTTTTNYYNNNNNNKHTTNELCELLVAGILCSTI